MVVPTHFSRKANIRASGGRGSQYAAASQASSPHIWFLDEEWPYLALVVAHETESSGVRRHPHHKAHLERQLLGLCLQQQD
jgi:hypothetical protein